MRNKKYDIFGSAASILILFTGVSCIVTAITYMKNIRSGYNGCWQGRNLYSIKILPLVLVHFVCNSVCLQHFKCAFTPSLFLFGLM